jgi:hypothetical protein
LKNENKKQETEICIKVEIDRNRWKRKGGWRKIKVINKSDKKSGDRSVRNDWIAIEVS